MVGVLMYTTRRVGVLLSEIAKHSKISPPPSLRSHLTSSPMGVLSGDYGILFRVSIFNVVIILYMYCTLCLLWHVLILVSLSL